MRPFYPALFVCFAGVGASAGHASATWLTLVGDPQDATSDYIQFDPSGLVRDKGIPTLPVRVSRVRPRTSQEGIVFRSYEAVVAVHCKEKSARFMRASFYAESDFKGTAFRTVVFDPSDNRPMAFREIKGEPAQRVVRAACNTTVKTISPDPEPEAGFQPPAQQSTTPVTPEKQPATAQ